MQSSHMLVVKQTWEGGPRNCCDCDREIYIKATSSSTIGGVEALTRRCGNFDQDLTRGYRIEEP